MIATSTAIAACAGFAAGWFCKAALERRQAAIALRDRARALANPPYSSAAIAWGAMHEESATHSRGIIGPLRQALDEDTNPPQQPLTADLIRYWQWRARAWSPAVSYWQWQDEQVRQALQDSRKAWRFEEDTTPPPGATP